jgi:hypothetical protein
MHDACTPSAPDVRPLARARPLRAALAALAFAATVASAACDASGRSDQTAVTLRARHAAGRAVSGTASRTFTTTAGEQVTLTRAVVTVSSVELFPCQSVAGRLWRWMSPVRIAWAHGVGTERRLAAPSLHDVLAPDGDAAELGQVHPFAGRYCWARVTVAPADADTPGAAAAGLVGASLVVEGTVAAADGSSPRPFSLRSGTTKGVDVTAFPALDLAKDAVARRTFVLTYGGWLDGVDPLASGAAEQVLAHLVEAIGAEE